MAPMQGLLQPSKSWKDFELMVLTDHIWCNGAMVMVKLNYVLMLFLILLPNYNLLHQNNFYCLSEHSS